MRDWCKSKLVATRHVYRQLPKKEPLYEESEDGGLTLPYGTYGTLWRLVKNPGAFSLGFHKSEPADFGGADVPLYPYQEEAVAAMLKAGYGMLQAPPGSGKTQMGIAIAVRGGMRTLWLCHTRDLVAQSKERAKRYMDASLIGEISGGKVKLGSAITFATIQTMARLDLSEYRDTFDCIITDEAHRVAGTADAATQYRTVLSALNARHKYGLSATVHRSDGLILSTLALVGPVMHRVPPEAVGDVIVPVAVQPIDTGIRPKGRTRKRDGSIDFVKLIDSLSEDRARARLIAGMIGADDRPTLVLSARLDHLALMMSLLPQEKRDRAAMISGTTRAAERAEVLDKMRSGELDVLFATYGLAKEGLDVPRLEVLHLATPQSDYAVVAQAVGRVARSCEGKKSPVAYDYVDDDEYLRFAFKKRTATYRECGNTVLPARDVGNTECAGGKTSQSE